MPARRLPCSVALIVLSLTSGCSSSPGSLSPTSAQPPVQTSPQPSAQVSPQPPTQASPQSAAQVASQPSEPASTGRSVTLAGQTTGSRINIRSAPSTTASIRHYGLVGDVVTVLAETRAADGYTWYQVQFPKSQATGWVRGDFIVLANSAANHNDSPETLPDTGDIRFRAVTYKQAETLEAPALEAAITRELSGDVANVRYLYTQIDLNNDGRSEVIAYLPTNCGTGGCSMMIFQPTGNGTYELVSRHTLIRNPIVVSNTTTNGWRDIVVFVAGGGAKAGYHILKFDGSTYPSNPSVTPELTAGTIVSGDAVIADRLGPGVGRSIPR